jgi:hypothetical protein
MRRESDRKWPGPAGGFLHRLNGEQVRAVQRTPAKATKPKKPVAYWTAVAKRCYEHPEATGMREYVAEVLGLSVDVVKRFRVGWGDDRYRGLDYSTWPSRDAAGRIVGITRRYRDGAKLTAEGGTPGLFYCYGWHRLSGTILLPEGASDTATLVQLGLSAVGRPSNVSAPWLPELLGPYREREIIVLGEHDRKEPGVRPGCRVDCRGCSACWPGRFGAEAVARLLAEQLKRSVTWWILSVKDVRVWLAENDGAVDVRLEDFEPAMVGTVR